MRHIKNNLMSLNRLMIIKGEENAHRPHFNTEKNSPQRYLMKKD